MALSSVHRIQCVMDARTDRRTRGIAMPTWALPLPAVPPVPGSNASFARMLCSPSAKGPDSRIVLEPDTDDPTVLRSSLGARRCVEGCPRHTPKRPPDSFYRSPITWLLQ
jgi:hypothetical protein